jgi:hypothetical protein
MPPFIMYKFAGRLYDNWMKGGPENPVYSTSLSGWMEKDQFSQWLEYVFVPETKKEVKNLHILLPDARILHLNQLKFVLKTMLCLFAYQLTLHLFYNLWMLVYIVM